jgi:hypothetical protein
VEQGRCDFQRMNERNKIAHAIDREVARALAKARVVDLTEAVCETPVCHPEVNGVVRYRDAHHLTTRFAASLAPLLSDPILGGPVNW